MPDPSELSLLRDQLAGVAARLNQVEIDSVRCNDALHTLHQEMQELRLREDYYRQLFETAKDGIAVLDAVNGRVLDINPYLADLIGHSRQELYLAKFWDLAAPPDVIHLQSYFRDLQQTGVIRFDDVCLRGRNGKETRVDVIANTFVDADGRKMQCKIRKKMQPWAHETLS